jgi:hypothetical protein
VENEWCLVSVRFQQESLSVFKKGGCPLSPRIRVRFQQELLSVFSKNECPFWTRICTKKDVRDFLKLMSKEILTHSSAKEIIECHINPYTANERRKLIIGKLEQIVDLV